MINIVCLFVLLDGFQSCMLRLKGRNIEENPHVKMGAFHTIELELNRKFELRKALWDSIHLDRWQVVFF